MLRKIVRKIKPNPLDSLLKKAKRNNKKTFLLAWNRALGDVSLGLYAVCYRIKCYIPDAKITFIIREDLKEAFELLGYNYITVPFWRRYVFYDIYHTLKLLKIDYENFDVIIEKPDPNYWTKWQLSKLVPKLRWQENFDNLSEKFNLPSDKVLIAVQPAIETKHSPWRSWPVECFQKLFSFDFNNQVKFVLIGTKADINFEGNNVIDLRGKTTLLEVLSIIKNKCFYFISLDSGILSLFYYLDKNFPIKLIALWGSKDVGVIRQNVSSPNKQMIYFPLYEKNLQNLKPSELKKYIFPNDIKKFLLKNNQKALLESFEKFSIQKKKILVKECFLLDEKVLKKQKTFFLKKNKPFFSLKPCKKANFAISCDHLAGKKLLSLSKAAAVIMAAGQGTRLGSFKSKGLFEINNKTLFEYFFEKILEKQKKFNKKLFVSIMTSHLNHLEICNFFKQKRYFGLMEGQVDFFIQKKAPFLDEKGNWFFLDNKILQAPDGNGSFYKSFYESAIFLKYLKKDIQFITLAPIDNPLCDPFDENLLGFHHRNKNEITIKCIRREEASNKQGAIAIKNNKIKIIEYMYQKNNQKKYLFFNTGIYVFNLEFLGKIKDVDLDYNYVLKKIKAEGDQSAYKSESFIFDGFDYADKLNILIDKKENFYSPLKDQKSLDDLKKILHLRNRI